MTLSLLCAAPLQGNGANKDLPSVAYIQWSPGQPRTNKLTKKKLIWEQIWDPALLQLSYFKNISNVL